MKKAQIHFFTGTGNSAHAVKVLADELIKFGWNVQTIRIMSNIKNLKKKQFNEPGNEMGDISLHVFLYPVFALSFPHIFLKYIKSMKDGKNVKTAIIANHGMINLKGGINTGSEGGGPAHAAAILKRRNFDVFLTGAVGYPENITVIADAIPDNDAKDVTKSADGKVMELAKKIDRYETDLKKYGILTNVFSMIFGFIFQYIGRRFFGKLYTADNDCNNCGICVKVCPVNAVKIFNKKPFWKWNCEACFACFNSCPVKSINISISRIFISLAAILIPIHLLLNFYDDISGIILQHINLHIFRFLFDFFAVSFSFIILYLILIVILDLIFRLLEQITALRKFFAFTYSKNFKRYIARDFKSFKN